MNAPRNDKDHFLYPYAIAITVTIKQPWINLQHKDIGILPSLQEKGKEVNNKQCMNTLLPWIRQSLFPKAITEYLTLLEIKTRSDL